MSAGEYTAVLVRLCVHVRVCFCNVNNEFYIIPQAHLRGRLKSSDTFKFRFIPLTLTLPLK